ncbi:flagellar hook-associated protein FlgL [Sulfurivermis fontis]|uniref:flagellar hook-associated protein FlgL n=1 Tax=Sulfurivermis fontis TaxID=1972068 RepID=UPI000FD82001|nr:flagellar hook-associated protein FlgL [Sulfurivermis fontis]
MRISSRFFQTMGVNSILDQQVKLSKTQNQLASGKRILTPSDDPVATSQLMQLRQTENTVKQYQANADAAVNRLSTEEGVLDSVTTLLQRVRELSIQAANATQTNDTRRFIASEVRQRLEELVGLANTKDGNGEYLFAGSKGFTEPFVPNAAGGYDYFGDDNQRFLQIGDGRQVADGNPGSEVFQLIRNGNGTFVTEVNQDPLNPNQGTGVIDGGSVQGSFIPALTNGVNGYTLRFIQAAPTDPITYEVFETGDPTETPITLADGTTVGTYVDGEPIAFRGALITVTGTPVDGDTFTIRSSEYQDIFQTLSDFVRTLETSVNTPSALAQLNNNIGSFLSNIEQGMNNILTVRASVGARLNAIDGQRYINEDQLLQTTQIISSVEDLDYAEAVSRLNLQMAGLEAAQQTYLKVQGLSLFNYLR